MSSRQISAIKLTTSIIHAYKNTLTKFSHQGIQRTRRIKQDLFTFTDIFV